MENHWNGKLWFAYGTSMTSIRMGEYVPVVEELSGMRVMNNGIPGGSITPDGYGKGNIKRYVMNLDDDKAKADLITLEVLPNEGDVVGKIYDTVKGVHSVRRGYTKRLLFIHDHSPLLLLITSIILSAIAVPSTK